MKRVLCPLGLLIAVCALSSAQESGRVTVAGHGNGPRLVDAATSNGSITVKTYEGKEVIVESPSMERHETRTPPGMHRIDVPFGRLEVEEKDNTFTIRDHSPGGGASIVITVPVDTNLHLRSSNGGMRVEGVHGEIDAQTSNGSIRLMNVSGSVLASSHNSPVIVTMDRVDPSKPSAFSTLNGSVDVTLPGDVKATLKMTTDNGSIYSDFDVNVGAGRAVTEQNNTADGRYRVRFDRTINGSINGGGVEMTFRTANGSIVIRKKK